MTTILWVFFVIYSFVMKSKEVLIMDLSLFLDILDIHMCVVFFLLGTFSVSYMQPQSQMLAFMCGKRESFYHKRLPFIFNF